MRLIGALGGLSDAELRSTFNGGLGMVCVVPARLASRTAIASLEDDGFEAWQVGDVVAIGAAGRATRSLGGSEVLAEWARAIGEIGGMEEERRGTQDRGWRIGNRQQPACPARGAQRGALDAEIALVFADRECPALDWAVEQGIETLVVPMPKLSDDPEEGRRRGPGRIAGRRSDPS
jgi:hypothetical protein